MTFNFDEIDFSKLYINKESYIKDNIIEYDNTTNETYRIKRLYKLDPLTDESIPGNLLFEFKYKWDPITGERIGIDENGPLCFNAINLYNYYYANRYKGLWNPAIDNFEGFYGDLLGSGKTININSRGPNPEKYLFRLPIIDCYLIKGHNLSIITMGPILDDSEIEFIDNIVYKYNKNRYKIYTSLKTLKIYYDNALNDKPNMKCHEIKELKKNYPDISKNEILYRYNKIWVDKLVSLYH